MSIWKRRTAVIPAVLIFAAAAAGQQPNLGYDDTPMQPNGKWHIHDGKRPQPTVVTPGPATLNPVPPPAGRHRADRRARRSQRVADDGRRAARPGR